MAYKRVLTVQDISCVGQCSLTVALPILSACGLETGILPSAVLSTHTGGFTGYTFRDLTDDMPAIEAHWVKEGIRFDAVYTGYLGSARQIDCVKSLLHSVAKPGCLAVVDPAMADNGKMYATFQKSFAEGMRELCRKADMIVPNITEACFMLGMPYTPPPYKKEDIEDILSRLIKLGVGKVVLTGVCFDDAKLGAACMDTGTMRAEYAFAKCIKGFYHGTGDIFASVLLAAYMNEKSPIESVDTAVRFTAESIERTYVAGTDVRYGVNFEAGLGKLIRELGK